MTNSPRQKPKQDEYIKTALRLPVDLHAEIQASAERNGRSMNAEMIARMQSSPIKPIEAELSAIKAALRKILDAVT